MFSAIQGTRERDSRMLARRTSGAAGEGAGRGDATRCQAWCRLAPYGGTPKPPGAGYRASIGSRSGLSSAYRNCAQASAHCQLPS